MASFKEGQTKNVICKGQWFTLIYMTAVKNKHFTKKAFLYIFFSTFIELVLTQTKNVICKGQWFTLIYMTAVKNKHFTKKAFLYIFFSTFIELVLNYIVELFSHQCLSTKRTLHFVAFVSSARCKIVASFRSTGMCRRQNFKNILKMIQQSIEFFNIFLSSPLLLLFLPHFSLFLGIEWGSFQLEKF